MRNPIFLYHSTPARIASALERQLRVIATLCEVVPLADIIAKPSAEGTSLRPRAALTFDDGLRSNVVVAYPILRRLGLSATFFVCPGLIERQAWLWTHEMRCRLGSLSEPALEAVAMHLGAPGSLEGIVEWMKRLPIAARHGAEADIRAATPRFRPSAAQHADFDLASWDELRRLDPRIVAIGSHTMTHPILSSLPPAETQNEVRESRAAIEREIGRPADVFCYPNGDFNEAALDAVRRCYRAALTESERSLPHWDPHRIPRVGEDRAGWRGLAGLVRKIWFPYTPTAPLSAAAVALVRAAEPIPGSIGETLRAKSDLRRAA